MIATVWTDVGGSEKKKEGGGNGASLHSAMSDSASIREWKSHACAEHVA